MAGIGLLFLLIGAISIWIVERSVVIGEQSINMDLVGLIFLILGLVGVGVGLYQRNDRGIN